MNLKQLNKIRLEEIKSLIEEIPSGLYVEPLEVLNGSTIGQHFRHIIEFYLCLMQSKDKGLVCYDERKRDLRIEEDRQFSMDRCDDFIDFIQTVEGDSPLFLLADLSAGDGVQSKLRTSLERELAYVMDHGVHHLAIIKIALAEMHLNIGADIGVAAATLRYRKQCAQ